MQGLGLVILSQHLEAKGPCFTKLELNLPTCLALCVIKLPGPLCPQVPTGHLPARSSCLSLPPAFFPRPPRFSSQSPGFEPGYWELQGDRSLEKAADSPSSRVMSKNMSFSIRIIWACVQVPLLIGCMTLGTFLNLCICEMGIIVPISYAWVN